MATNPSDLMKSFDETGSSPASVPFGFGQIASTTDVAGPAPAPTQTWGQMVGDIGKSFMGSAESQIGGVEQYFGSTIEDPALKQSWQRSGADWTKSGQDWTGSVSPGGKAITEAPLFSSTTAEHPLSKTLMGVGKGGLWNAAALIPGAGWGSMAVRGAVGAGLGLTGAYSGVLDSINAQPDDQLQKSSPDYLELRKQYPEYQAKQMLADQAWSQMSAGSKAAIVGTSALAGEAGPLATVGKAVTSAGGKTLASFASGRLAQAGIGAAETGAVQAGQYAGTAIPTREALTSVGAPADTPGQIAMGSIESAAVGAVIGGGARSLRRPPIGGENVTGRDLEKGAPGTGAKVGEVPAGQPDPAQASALKSSAQPTPGQQLDLPLNQPQQPARPPPMLPGAPPPEPPRGPYQQPLPLNYWRPPAGAEAPIPPRPAAPPPDMTAPRPGELPLEQPGQPPQRQGELPLQPQQPPVQQASLDLGAPRQPITQLGLPGMGMDTTVQPGETIARPPEVAPKPEPKVTKVSEPEPAAAPEGLKGRVQQVVDDHPTPEGEKVATLNDRKAVQERAASIDNKITSEDKKTILALPKEEAPLKSYVTFANILADKKVPTASDVRNFLNAEKQVRDHLGGEAGGPEEPPTSKPGPTPKPVSAVTKVSEPTEPATPTKKLPPKAAVAVAKSKAKEEPTGPAGKGKISFDQLKAKLKGEPTEPPAPTKAEIKRQAAIEKIVGKKEEPTQVTRPTVEPTGEPKVTVVPPSSALLGGIKPGEKAKAIAAQFAPKGEELPKAPEPPTTTVKSFNQLKAALAKKGEEAVTVTGKVGDAIKAVLPAGVKTIPAKAAAAIAKAKNIEEAKKQVAANPTVAQKAAGNYKQGHPPTSETQGQKVTITSAAGKVGQAVGKILGTAKNIPGKHLETVISSPNVVGKFHVINELHPDTAQFVGHVAVQGAKDASDASTAFNGKMRDKYSLDAVLNKNIAGGIVEMSPEEFEHFKQTRNPNEPVYQSTEGKHPLDVVDVGNKVTSSGVRIPSEVKTLGSMTAKTALEEALRRLPNEPRYAIYRKLAEQAIKYIPDVPIYNLRQQDLERVAGKANAAYSPTLNQILMGTSSKHPDLTLLHEVLHAATLHLYSNNAEFKGFVDRITQEYKRGISSLPNGVISHNVQLGGGKELLAEMAKPEIQEQLARMQMSDKLADDLGMSTLAKTSKTLWNGLVKSFKDGLEALGMKLPGKDDPSKFSLLDGMLRMTDEAFMARSKQARTDFGNMRRVMEHHAESMDTTREREHNSQQNISDTVRDAVEHPERAQDHYVSEAKSISDRAEDLLDKAPRGIGTAAYYNVVSKLMTTDAFRMANEKYFGKLDEANPLRKYVEKTLQRATDFQERLRTKADFVAQMAKATAEIGRQETEKLSDLLSKATAYRFDPRHAVGEGLNSWLGAAAKRAEKGDSIFYKHQQALDKSGEIAKDFDELHPTAKKWFGKLVDDYHAKGRERAEIAVDALMHTIDSEGPKLIPEPKIDPKVPSSKDAVDYAKWHNDFEQNWEKNREGLRQRILDDDLTDNDKQWLENRGIDTTDDIHTLSVPKGPYVPLDHAGDWIINARYKINGTEGAKQINDNTFEFKTQKEMEDFLRKQPPNSRPYTVHYNDEGAKVPKWDKWQNKDGSVGFAKDNQAWRVEVNDKYYSGHDNLTSATRRFKELNETGAFAKIAEPQMKQAGWYSQLEVSSPLFKKLIASVDRRTDYTDDQKKAVKQLLTDTAVSSMEGNRIAKTLLPRKLVAGWDTDFIKTYDKYADMHNALMSRNKYAKDMGTINSELVKHAKDNEFTPGATERSGVLSELHDRDNFFGSPDYVGETTSKFGKLVSPVLRKAGVFSFLQNMASVGHLITHSTHQILTADMVAAKYGGLGTMGEAARLHSILAGAGFKNAWKSIVETKNVITKDSKGLNYVESLMDKLENNHRYGAELRNFINKAIETGRVHPDQGFDTSIYHMSTGKIDAALSKLDRASRQTMGAIEAYNRIWGHSLAYIRAREAGESIEQATRSSYDMVSRTQGLLSRANMAPIMSKWYMRAPMQFRGWGMNIMMNIANSIYNGFKGETREIKVEAWKRLAYLFGTTAALTGVNGLPSDPMRIALALAGALGITNYNWSDAQNTMREKLAELGGTGFANLAMDGMIGSAGPFAFFGADRIGFGSLAVFGEPQSTKGGDIAQWMWQLVGGAPGQTAQRMVRGGSELAQGNYADGVKDIVPIKLIDDWAKAWKGATQGVPTTSGVPGMSPYSIGETIMQGMGLTPARRERYREAREAESRAEQSSRDETGQILNAVGQSREGPERLKAMQQVSAYNLQHPEDRITSQDVMKAIRRSTAPSALGHTFTNRNRQRLQQLEQYYGL